MSVSADQRFTRKNPCPVCGGGHDEERGQGIRCWGFLSEDGKYAHCTNEEWKAGLLLHQESSCYVHLVSGTCECGLDHEEVMHDEEIREYLGLGQKTVWSLAEDAADFIARKDSDIEGLDDEGLLFRGAVTGLFAPRGLGKSQLALATATKLASTGRRVLLVDRDNSSSEVRRRLKAWGISKGSSLSVLTRDNAPPLTDREKWKQFPVGDYDLVIIDSLDSFTEGVGERDSAKPSQAISALLDVLRQADGPAVLLLGNTVKDGSHSRGSGVIEDRLDIVFEVRDATGFTPTGKKPWWEELPEAGASTFASRATRRKKSTHMRLALIPSKYRISVEPSPFVVEIDFSDKQWEMKVVTDDLVEASEHAQEQTEDHVEQCKTFLADTVVTQFRSGNPFTFSKAEDLLKHAFGLSRKTAREVINEGSLWRLERQNDLQGKPVFLLPLNLTDQDQQVEEDHSWVT